MASDAVPGRAELALQADDGVSPVKQELELEVEDRLVTLSDRITLCNRVLEDLKDLNDVLRRKSLQTVSLLKQK